MTFCGCFVSVWSFIARISLILMFHASVTCNIKEKIAPKEIENSPKIHSTFVSKAMA